MLVGFASTEGGCAHYRAELPGRHCSARGLPVALGADLAVAEGEPIGLTTRDLDPDRDQLVAGTRASDGSDEAVAAVMFDDGWIEPDVLVLAGGYPFRLGADVIGGAVAAGQRVVCDLDDYPWVPAGNPTRVEGDGEMKLAALRAASAVTTSTPALQRVLAKQGVDAIVCRNNIAPDRYRDERLHNIARRMQSPRGGELTVAYRGMLAGFHDEDARQLRGYLPRAARYVHVGADPRSARTFRDVTRAPLGRVEERPAVVFEQYGPQLAGVDVALIPYAPRPASSCKSNIAALEWSAAGVPWLAHGNPDVYQLDPAHGWFRWDDLADELERLRDPDARAAIVAEQWDALREWCNGPASLDAWFTALAAVGVSTAGAPSA